MIATLKRREFITLLGGTVAWPLSARAQQSGRLIRLGFLGPSLNNPPAIAQYQAFRTQLGDLVFREGQNLAIDYRGLDDPRGPFVVAAELVRPQPDLIVTAGPETSLQAVVGASGFIPVVIIAVNFDPLARVYPRPGAAGQHHRIGLPAIGAGTEAGRAADPGVSRQNPVGPALRCAIGRPVRRRRAGRKGAELAGTSAAA